MSWIEAKLLPIANKIQRNKYLQAIQSAFMTCMPIMLVGSIVTILTRPWMDYTSMDPDCFRLWFLLWLAEPPRQLRRCRFWFCAP